MSEQTDNTVHSCQLYDLVLDLDWPAVKRHAKDHPEDARFEDGESRETPLYLACQLDPPFEVVQALIEAYPEAVLLPRKNGDLPLHVACRYLANAAVFETLLCQEPSTIFWTTRHGKTPFTALAEAFAQRIRTIQRDGSTEEEKQREIDSFLQSVKLRLRSLMEYSARQLESMQEDNSGKPLFLNIALHADALDTKMWRNHNEYARLVWDLAMEHDDGMLRRYNKDKRLPLHLALDMGCPATRRVDREVLQLMLQGYPKAAMIPDTGRKGGRLPLHAMIVNPSYTWNETEIVFQAAPQVLTMHDPMTNLLPFALAATIRGRSSLEKSFLLLAAQPDVIAAFCDPIPETQSWLLRDKVSLSAIGVTLAAVLLSFVSLRDNSN